MTCSFSETCSCTLLPGQGIPGGKDLFLNGNGSLEEPQRSGWELKGDNTLKEEENEQSSRLMEMLALGIA